MSIDLAAEYAKATEWSLATLEELALIKTSSASRIRRQRNICVEMLGVCAGISTSFQQRGRTRRLLGEMARGATAMHVLDKMIASLRDGWTT